MPTAATTARAAWERIQKRLEKRINPPSFNTWLRPCVAARCEPEALVLRVPTAEHEYWLTEHYIKVLIEVFEREFGEPPDLLDFEIAEQT